jgi:tetratricopeptide (TPR) repeat protein
VVVGLLAGRSEFPFVGLGRIELKGLPEPVASSEVLYEAGQAQGVVADVPMVGRDAEFARLTRRLARAFDGRGALALVAGEPGIGKTRMAEELADRAKGQGAQVLVGQCYEGEWAPPYAPFAEAVDAFMAAIDPVEVAADLGPGAGPLAQLVPAVRKAVPDIGDPVPLQPDEERFRLFEAMANFLVARSQRAPVLLCVEDLHWADKGTVAMLRHIARSTRKCRILTLGTYRDVDLEATHPLADALGAFPRETDYEHISLDGLTTKGTAELLAALGHYEVANHVGEAWAKETEGNPFFIQELVRYFAEEGKVFRGTGGRWTTTRPLQELGIPQSVRDVIGRRLARLSPAAGQFLGVAAIFEGEFAFDVATAVAGLRDDEGLDALDEALRNHLLRCPGTGARESCTFTHALTRHAVYCELSGPRRIRLHRRAAQVLEDLRNGHPAPSLAAEIAFQYHRSAGLPGAEQGVDYALAAAANAEGAAAHDSAARFLRMAIELLPAGDRRRPRLLGRLGLALTWARAFDEAAEVAAEAGAAIRDTEGAEAATEYLSEAAYAANMAGSPAHAWSLARQGLADAGTSREVAWARLVAFDHMHREAEERDEPGIPVDTPERRAAARILLAAHLDPMGPAPMEAVFDSRDEALASSNLIVRFYWAGEYNECVPLLRAEAEQALARSQLNRAARCRACAACVQAALGQLDAAKSSLQEAVDLSTRLGEPIYPVLQARETLAVALDEGLEDLADTFAVLTGSPNPALYWALGSMYAWAGRVAAALGETQAALRYLGLLTPWLTRAPTWTVGFPVMACHAAEMLWRLQRLDHVDVVEVSLREKLIPADFRAPLVDSRLALARLHALQGHYEEAEQLFDGARRVLGLQSAASLLAIVDYDRALMYVRRARPHDAERARTLLDAALRQFRAMGMTGWIRQASELSKSLR